MWRVLMVLEVILVVPGVVLVVLGALRLSFWENYYKDCNCIGTLDGLHQHTLIAAGTRLRLVEATFFGHILGTKPFKI